MLTATFETRPPVHRPRPIVHAPPGNENLGDTLAWQTEHQGKRGDQNFQVTNNALLQPRKGFQIWMMHSDTPIANGYLYIMDVNGSIRQMTKREQHRHLSRWTSAGVRRWRKGPYETSDRPHTWEEAVVHAKRVGFHIIPETKNPKFRRIAVAKMMRDVAEKHDYPLWPMTLFNMRYAKGKVAAFAAVGIRLSIIFGKRQYARPLIRRLSRNWKPMPPHLW